MFNLLKKVRRRPRYALTALGRQLRAKTMPAPEGRPFIADRLSALGEAFSSVSGTTDRGKAFGHGAMQSPHAEMLWHLVRSHQPERVIETGVCNGLSTAVILEAMRLNGHGELISIDLPEFTDGTGTSDQWEGKGGAVIPVGKKVGWLVTDPKRWKLVLGRSQDLLPDLSAQGCDIFIHDGEHSYDCQFFEFDHAWRALSPNGVVVATDINASNAFDHWRRKAVPRPKIRFLDHSCAVAFRAG